MEAARKSAEVCGLSYVRFTFKKMGKEKDAVGETFMLWQHPFCE